MMILTAGIDVSKDKLDIFYNNQHVSIKNDQQSIKEYFSGISKSSQIVLEATGKYHRLSHTVLTEMGFAVMVINPYQSRHFAKSLNINCKTDKVDAKILSLYGEKIGFTKTPPLTDTELHLQELMRHLDDLKKIKLELQARKRESRGFVNSSLDKAIASITEEIKATEKELDEAIDKDAALKEKVNLLLTIPGIGQTTAMSLICLLRELGSVNKRQIAALAGLAPFNNDSGKFKGKRMIKRGRHDVRTHLYMPILGAATQHNPRLKNFYDHLIAKGKLKKVALTACMRKIIVWANAMLTTMTTWGEFRQSRELTQ